MNCAPQHCHTCRFWPMGPYWRMAAERGKEISERCGETGHHGDGSVSRCVRNAPSVPMDAEYLSRTRPFANAQWPLTQYDDWCGQWEPRSIPAPTDNRGHETRMD